MDLQLLATNRTGPARRETFDGREYLVAPINLIVPGVLNGSNGPLLYPADEVGRHPDIWNGVPLTDGHPADPSTGKPVSGRSPKVYDRVGLGHVYHVEYDPTRNRLRGEGWFDAARTKTVNPDVYAALVAGKPVEVSTGVFTKNTPVSNGVHSDGRTYAAVARDYRADHLAVLVGATGACSVRDGCGLNVNSGTNCGIGEGGFQRGNHCAGGSGGKKVKTTRGKPSKSADKAATAHATDLLRRAGEARTAGDLSKSKNLSAAAYGYHKAAAHHAAGDHKKAEAVKKVADEYASGKRNLSSTTKPKLIANVEAFVRNNEAVMNGPVKVSTLLRRIADHLGITANKTPPVVPGKTPTPPKSNPKPTRSNNSRKGKKMTRTDAVAELTANCECWKGKAETLSALDTPSLNAIYKGYKALSAVASQLGVKPGELTANNAAEVVGKLKAKPDGDEQLPAPDVTGNGGKTPAADKPAPTGNASGSRLTAEETATLNWAKEKEQKERAVLVGRLTANSAPDKKDALAKLYGKMATADLELAASALPDEAESESFAGNSGGTAEGAWHPKWNPTPRGDRSSPGSDRFSRFGPTADDKVTANSTEVVDDSESDYWPTGNEDDNAGFRRRSDFADSNN